MPYDVVVFGERRLCARRNDVHDFVAARLELAQQFRHRFRRVLVKVVQEDDAFCRVDAVD